MHLELGETELWHAYRRAKADCRQERLQNGAIEYANFEQRLREGLKSFALRAQQGPHALFPNSSAAGSAFWVLKGTTSEAPAAHHVIVDPNDRWDACAPHKFSFRPICKPSIDTQILSALWLMRVGSRIDLELKSSCLGNRLRRFYSSGEVNLVAYSSFKHYAKPYQTWRETTLLRARRLLDEEDSAVVVTFDINNCYPSLTTDRVFAAVDQEFGPEPLSELLRSCVDHLNRILGTTGLPIGLTASAVLANYCLAEIDGWFSNHSNIHYGRYVDDVALVLPTKLASSPSVLLATLGKISGGRISTGELGDWRISLAKVGLPLTVSAQKTRVIQLKGATGRAMLASIQSDGALIASEWRLLPKATEFSGTAAKLLNFSRDQDSRSVKLRDIDTSSINKFAFSTALRHVAVLAQALEPTEAVRTCRDVLTTAIHHAGSAPHTHEFVSYWKRITVLVLVLGDESLIDLLIKKLSDTRDRLASAAQSRDSGLDQQKMKSFIAFVSESLLEALVTAFIEPQLRARTLTKFNTAGWSLGADTTAETFRRVFWSDLASISISQYVLGTFSLRVSTPQKLRIRVPISSRETIAFCRELGRSKDLSGAELHRRFALSTRPPRWADIFRASKVARADESFAARVYEAFRGSSPEFHRQDSGSAPNIRVALSSFNVTEQEVKAAICGSPILTAERFDAVSEIVRAAQKHRADMLVFPELSIPRRWIDLIESYLELSRISLVAGLEYSLHGRQGDPRLVANEAAISIAEVTRSGFTRHRPYRRRKRQPAITEALELRKQGAEHTVSEIASRQIYDINGVRIAVFICSELTDSLERADLRGAVDALVAIEYNRDLTTFRALTDSTSLDLHCFVIQCNNRLYGDSRIRSPASQDFERELAALRGGINDHVVLVDLPVRALRDFQEMPRSSQVGSEPQTRLRFKPVPDGWKRR